MRNTRDTGVQSVARAIEIMEALASSRTSVGVVDLARRVRLPVSTTHRLLRALQQGGLVRKDARSGRHELGLKLVELSAHVLDSLDLRAVARPVLERLQAETRETVHLALLDQTDVVYIDKLDSTRSLRMYSRIGRRVPVYCTALGKALLAFSDEGTVRTILGRIRLRRRTANTITSRAALYAELAEVRRRGFAVDNIEFEDGIRCVGAPVFDHAGRCAAAISLSAPAVHLPLRRIEHNLGPLVRAAAMRVSRQLGSPLGKLVGKEERR